MNKVALVGIAILVPLTVTAIALAGKTVERRVTTDVYQLSTTEWGYTITQSGQFIHAERGLATEAIAQSAASDYVKKQLGGAP